MLQLLSMQKNCIKLNLDRFCSKRLLSEKSAKQIVKKNIIKKKNHISKTKKTKINKALKLIEKKHSSKQASRQVDLSCTTLECIRYKSEQPSSLPEKCEVDLNVIFGMKSKWGYDLCSSDLKEFVRDYLKATKELNTNLGKELQKYCFFKNDTPDGDWIRSFKERWNLSTETASTLSRSRMDAARDPDTIYNFYDLLEQTMRHLKILNRPECVWSSKETSLLTNPMRSESGSIRGEKPSTSRNTITVMAGVSAASEKLPPVIILKGKNAIPNWMSESKNLYPGTQVAVCESGRMTSNIFFSWFCEFCDSLSQRPLLLVYDGPSNYLDFRLMTKAIEEDVTLLKPPPHTTDCLQPLHVGIFNCLEKKWGEAITNWKKLDAARCISSNELISLIGQIWNDVFTKQNIAPAFHDTGIYPLNRGKYPKDMFLPRLLSLYKAKEKVSRKKQKSRPASSHIKVRKFRNLLQPSVNSASTTTSKSTSTTTSNSTSAFSTPSISNEQKYLMNDDDGNTDVISDEKPYEPVSNTEHILGIEYYPDTTAISGVKFEIEDEKPVVDLFDEPLKEMEHEANLLTDGSRVELDLTIKSETAVSQDISQYLHNRELKPDVSKLNMPDLSTSHVLNNIECDVALKQEVDV